MALFLRDDGLDPPYGSNPLLTVNFLYSTQRLPHSKSFSETQQALTIAQERNTPEDQLGLVKLARVTLYQAYGDFDICHFDTRNCFFFQVGGMRFLKECLQALLPSTFLAWIPVAADPACCLLAFFIVLTDREPGTG